MATDKNHVSIIYFIPLVLLSSFSIDITIGIISKLVYELHTNQQMLQMTISEYLFMMGCGQLFVGPIIDRIGLTKTIYLSITVYLIGTLLCMVSLGIYHLIIFRLIEAMGSSGILVSAFVFVQRSYTGEEASHAFSLINGSLAASPLFAPYVGSYLHFYFGWRSIFLFLALCGLACMVITFIIGNKLPRIALEKSSIIVQFKKVFKKTEFMKAVIILVILSEIIFLYTSTSPYIYVELFKVEPTRFADYFFSSGAFFILGSYISTCLTVQGQKKSMFIGLILILICGITMLSLGLMNQFSIFTFLILACTMTFGTSFFFGPITAYALSFFATGTAAASSILGSFQFALPAIIGQAIMTLDARSVYPLSITIIISSLLTLFIVLSLKTPLPKTKSEESP